MGKTNRLAWTHTQGNAHSYLHAKLNNHDGYNVDFAHKWTRVHAIICLQTTGNKTYILALGHELTHSYTTDEKVHKRMWKRMFIRGLDMHMCKFLPTKEATLSRGRMPFSEWRLTLALLRLSICLFFGGFRWGGFDLRSLPPCRLPLHPLYCSFTTSCSAFDYAAFILLLTILHTVHRQRKRG